MQVSLQLMLVRNEFTLKQILWNIASKIYYLLKILKFIFVIYYNFLKKIIKSSVSDLQHVVFICIIKYAIYASLYTKYAHFNYFNSGVFKIKKPKNTFK